MSRHPAPAPDDRARRLPRAVLWDMDGTLVDTEPLWNAVQRRLVVKHGGTWSEDLAASLVGRPLDEGARRLQAAGLDLPVQRIIDLTMDEVVQGVVRGVPWRPGARELLVALAEAGVPGALVTMSHAPLARALAERAPAGTLDVVVSGDMVSRGKPDPEAYRLGLQLLAERTPGLTAADDGKDDRGIFFIFISARAYDTIEFLQQEWINRGNFLDLGQERDPVVGLHEKPGSFTIPAEPARRRLEGVTTFNRLRGGEYMFMPSLSALEWIGRAGWEG